MPNFLPQDVLAASFVDVRPHWQSLLNQAVQMASLVRPPGTAPVFLLEMAAGRFRYWYCYCYWVNDSALGYDTLCHTTSTALAQYQPSTSSVVVLY